jgi:hypothetical protein
MRSEDGERRKRTLRNQTEGEEGVEGKEGAEGEEEEEIGDDRLAEARPGATVGSARFAAPSFPPHK